MDQIDANQLLTKMRMLAQEASQSPMQLSVSQKPPEESFSHLLTQAINSVNGLQKDAGNLVKRFEAHDPEVNITDVMVAMQKSSLAFQAMTQVRNQVVSAYQDIMKMSV